MKALLSAVVAILAMLSSQTVPSQALTVDETVFLVNNKLLPGVVSTPSGLQYQILRSATGIKPQATSTVRVHYRGTLQSGDEFDSSYKRGKPSDFPLEGVIEGLREGLQLMRVGEKFRFFVPSKLAFGTKGAGKIPPNSMLVFEFELLDVVSSDPKAAIGQATKFDKDQVAFLRKIASVFDRYTNFKANPIGRTVDDFIQDPTCVPGKLLTFEETQSSLFFSQKVQRTALAVTCPKWKITEFVFVFRADTGIAQLLQHGKEMSWGQYTSYYCNAGAAGELNGCRTNVWAILPSRVLKGDTEEGYRAVMNASRSLDETMEQERWFECARECDRQPYARLRSECKAGC